jgi:hypothetical protein
MSRTIAVDSVGQAHIREPAELAHAGALPELTLSDRCDGCPRGVSAAQVGVRLRSTGSRFYLCGHHWRRHRAALEPLTDAIVWAEGATHA